jgi:hypothetical protein
MRIVAQNEGPSAYERAESQVRGGASQVRGAASHLNWTQLSQPSEQAVNRQWTGSERTVNRQ